MPIDDGYIRARFRDVVRCTGRRDYIELRNDIIMLRALEKAKEDGCSCIYLGEGGDELFLGYSFMRTMRGYELRRPRNRHQERGA